MGEVQNSGLFEVIAAHGKAEMGMAFFLIKSGEVQEMFSTEKIEMMRQFQIRQQPTRCGFN